MKGQFVESNEKLNTYKDHRQYLWNYFQLHSSQRLTTFNFYIVFSTVLTTGCLNILSNHNLSNIVIALGLLLIFLSFVFWKIDSRNRQLIKNAENALKYLEEKLVIDDAGEEDEIIRIFSCEQIQTERLKQSRSFAFWKNLYSYSNCFNLMFLIFGSMGAIAVVFALLNAD